MAITDKFKKGESLFSTTLSSGIGTGTGETITLASVTGLPTDTEITLTLDRVDANGTETPSNMERITGTIVGSALTSYTRGTDGSTEQSHSASAVIEYIFNAQDLNDIIDGVLIGHTQAGVHEADLPLTTPRITTSIDDSAGNELIKVTATGSAINEVTLANAAAGNSPTVTASGETNVGMDFKMKGTEYMRKPTIVHIPAFAPATDTETGNGRAMFEIPEELDGMNITAVGAYVYTAGVTGTLGVQIRNTTQSDADILSTVITIDTTEESSGTAATPAVIDTGEDDLQTADILAIDVDAVHSGTAAKGLTVWFRGELP